MKIKCTARERENLIDIFVYVCSTEICPFTDECEKYESCIDVFENEIEWEV